LLIPPPRFHTLRFHGVLAPHAAWRSAVIPARPEADEDGPRRRWDRRVRVRRGGRRCCAGCSASTSLRVRAAAAGGGWWGCTPGASACGPCSSGWGSSARRPRRSRRARRRDGARNRTRHSFSAFPRPDGSGPRAVVCLPASFWPVPCPASSLRGPSSRRLAALLSAVEGHRPSLALPEALDLGRRGRDRGARPGGRGKGLTTAKGRFEFLASARGRAQTAELSDAPSSRDRPRGSRIDDRRGGRYLACPRIPPWRDITVRLAPRLSSALRT